MIHSRNAPVFVVLAIVSVAAFSAVPGFLVDRSAAAAGGMTADVVYRSTTGSNGTSAPNHRTGTSSWTAEAELTDAGSPIRAVRMAASPVSASARIFVTQGDDGWLDAYVCTTTCAASSDVGQVWTNAPGTLQRRFDIAYEQLSGQALLVYGTLSNDATHDIAYRTYAGGVWSVESYLDDTVETSDVQYSVITVVPRKGSDQIGLLGGETTNNHVNAWIWDGNAFGSYTEISGNAQTPNRERGALAWEASSGHLLAIAVDANAQDEIVWKEYTTDWSTASNQACGSSGNILRWLSLKPNPSSSANDMVLASGDDGSELSTCYWTGSAWDARVSQDTSLDATSTRAFDFAWESSANCGLLAYGTSGGQITWRSFVAPSNWSSPTDVAMGQNTHAWVQLRTNPAPAAGDARILGAVLENSANSLGAVSWNASELTVLGADTFTADAGTGTYESFDLEFRVAGTPGTGTDPGGDPLTLPFGLQLDTRMLLILVAVVGAIVLIGVAARRRRRAASRGGSQPSVDQDFPAPEELAPEPPEWGP